MRTVIVAGVLALAGCSAPDGDLRKTLTTADLMMNRPNTDILDARFQLLPDGTGSVEFLGGTHGAQPVAWTLNQSQLCLAAENGLIASFGCAEVDVFGAAVLLSHTGSDSTATGVLVPR